MYRLLIVDDEQTITDVLYEVFQNRMDPELEVYKAYSGMEALKVLDMVRIDIVLADIHMPGMDGLQLLKEIRNKWPECRVIFLTGYTEFDYVYSAIQYPGVNYLLKTEDFDKIIQAVQNAASDIERSLKNKEILLKAERQIKYASWLFMLDYLGGVVNGEYEGRKIEQEELDRLGIGLSSKQPVLILLGKLDEIPAGLTNTTKSTLFCSVKLIVEQYLNYNISFVHYMDDSSDLVWLIQPGKERISEDGCDEAWKKIILYIKGALELAQSACMETAGVSTSFVLDDSYVGWHDIPQRFQLLRMFLQYRLGPGRGMLITDKRIMGDDLKEESGPQKGNDPDENIGVNRYLLDQLNTGLENLLREEFFRAFRSLTAGLAGIKSRNHFAAQELYYSISLVFLTYVNKWSLTEQIGSKFELGKLMLASEHTNWKDAVNYLEKLGNIIFEIQNSEQEKRTQDVIKKVRRHIDSNIGNADEITLVRLADLVHFNQSYLSRLYKQVSGCNLSEYISESRMKKAKELLESNDYKIQEIAEAVGFVSPTNFARFFKKFEGVTPQEYRDSAFARK